MYKRCKGVKVKIMLEIFFIGPLHWGNSSMKQKVGTLQYQGHHPILVFDHGFFLRCSPIDRTVQDAKVVDKWDIVPDALHS